MTDTGVGMDAAALARIFEPYFSTKATGTGLGLTIARRNVELNRGRIEVSSTQGLGTTVSLWLPVAADGAPVDQGRDQDQGADADADADADRDDEVPPG